MSARVQRASGLNDERNKRKNFHPARYLYRLCPLKQKLRRPML